MADAQIEMLLALIDEAYDRKSWHGTNLHGSIRGLSAKAAAWRPGRDRHNIWELTLHAAYWKYTVRRRLLREAKGSFPIAGSNFFERPAGSPTESDWKHDVAILAEIHKTLRAAIAGMTPRSIRATEKGSKVSNLQLIHGIAAHDLYHAGQIQLIKRMCPLE